MSDVYDMSVQACMERYDAVQDEERKSGASASMMDGYHCYPFDQLAERDPRNLKHIMTWNGTNRIDRPDWLAVYHQWRDAIVERAKGAGE